MGLNVVVMGPPGAGKGTQTERFARERNVPKISTGDILRETIKAGTPLGRRAQAILDEGKLVDDATMIGIVRERLTQPDTEHGFLLDGFPRTVTQAEALDRLIAECCSGQLIVVEMQVPEEELIRRLATRSICENCGTNADPFNTEGDACKRCGGQLVQRIDDDEGIVRKRLGIYARQTSPVVEYYRARPTFRIVNGAQAPDHVARDLNRAIDNAASIREGRTAGARLASRLESLL